MIYDKGDKNLRENPESSDAKNQASKEAEAATIKIQIQKEVREAESLEMPESGARTSPSKILRQEGAKKEEATG